MLWLLLLTTEVTKLKVRTYIFNTNDYIVASYEALDAVNAVWFQIMCPTYHSHYFNENTVEFVFTLKYL